MPDANRGGDCGTHLKILFLYSFRALNRFATSECIAGSNPVILTRQATDRLVAEIQSLLGERHWHRELVRSETRGSVMSLTKRSGTFSIRDRSGAPTITNQSLGACE